MSDRTAQMEFGRLLDSIRTELASVISRIDSSTKYEIDGAATPESIAFDAEAELDKQQAELDKLHERILGEGGVADILDAMEIPVESVGDGSSGGVYV